MLKLTPILLAIGYALLMYQFSAWKLRRELDEMSTELADPGLRDVTDRMARALDLPRIRVHIHEVDVVNGLAAPDGRIFITRGFYEKYKAGDVSAEELASVIAHELGHVALGHSRRRMVDFSAQNAIRATLMMVLARFLPAVLLVQVVNFGISLLAARLSRGDEYEADAYASALLHKAGIGLGPQKSLFAKLDALTKMRGQRPPAWLLSHPKTEERIAAIEAMERRWSSV